MYNWTCTLYVYNVKYCSAYCARYMLWDTVEWWCHLVIIFSVTWADWSIHRMCERCSAYCVYCIQLVCVCAWEVASSLLSNMYLLWALKNKHSIASLLSHSHACPAYTCARTHTRRTTPPSNDNINSSNPPPFLLSALFQARPTWLIIQGVKVRLC